jgi:hypothetical protein
VQYITVPRSNLHYSRVLCSIVPYSTMHLLSYFKHHQISQAMNISRTTSLSLPSHRTAFSSPSSSLPHSSLTPPLFYPTSSSPHSIFSISLYPTRPLPFPFTHSPSTLLGVTVTFRIPVGGETSICYLMNTAEYCSEVRSWILITCWNRP